MDVLGVVLFVAAEMHGALDRLIAVGFWFRREGVVCLCHLCSLSDSECCVLGCLEFI